MRLRLFKSWLMVLGLVSLALAFQNCGQGFKVGSEITGNTTLDSITDDKTQCNAHLSPGRAPLRFLSNTEYDNIATDVLLSKRKPSVDAKFIVPAEGSSGFTNTSLTSEPSAPAINGVVVEKFWSAAGSLADEVIASKSQAGSFYSQSAACAAAGTSIAESCYDSIVRSLALKLWRRPVTEGGGQSEFARLKAILKNGKPFDVGFRDLIKALLISPNFLVVAWTPKSALAPGQAFKLDQFQLASRLSFFLWQSAPDEALLSLAKNGTLANPTNLKAEVLRMLKDPKAKRLATVMTNEWLGVQHILEIGLTTVDNATLNSMLTETQLMFEDIVMNDTNFFNLLTADYSFLNKTLADYYGVPFNGAVNTQFYKTSLASTPRRGVLNQAAFLIATAGSPNATHPVLRGKQVAKKFGCIEIEPPPANLDVSLPPNIPANSTPAEVLALHTQRAQCAGCHRVLDPYGLALETYDSRGKWRTNYMEIAGRPVDASGTLPTGEKFSDTPDFMKTLAASASTKSCVVRKVMSLGLARKTASSEDFCSSTKISETNLNAGSKFSDLITDIVTSPQFGMQSTEAP